MKETLNKIGETSDKIISSIPIHVYLFVGAFTLLFIGQATYNYYTQPEPWNFTIDTSFLNDPEYTQESVEIIITPAIILEGNLSPSKIDLQNAQSKIISNYKNAIQDCNSLQCKEIQRVKYSNQIKQQLREFTVNKRLVEW